MNKLTRFTVDIEPDLHMRLKILAAKKKTTIRALLVEWIKAGLEKAEQEKS